MLCGVDEAGRGPVIGPLVVAGILVESDEALIELKVRDSKELSPSARDRLAVGIRKVAQVKTILTSAAEIDQAREAMTMNRLEAKLFASVLDHLRPTVAFVDSVDVVEENFRRGILAELHFPLELISRHKADSLYPVVSAASIIAKTVRDSEVARIEQELGEPIGSGYPADPVTVAFLKNWIRRKGDVPPHTRRSWDTSKRLLELASLKRLDEF